MDKRLLSVIAISAILSSGASANFFGFNDSGWFGGSMGGDLAPAARVETSDWFGGDDWFSGGRVSHAVVTPTPVEDAGYGSTTIETSEDAFKKLSGGLGIYHGGTKQVSTVTLATAGGGGGGGTTTTTPSLGGGDSDGGGYGAYDDATSSTGYRDADGNEVQADYGTGSFSHADRNGDGSVSAAEDLGFDI